MRHLLLVANPSASGFTGALFREVVAALGEHFDVAITWPTTTEAASAAARDAVSDGVDIVAAMGGDGVVHHVTRGIVGTKTALAILPVGTTNVLNRILGLPADAVKSAKRLAKWEPHRIPLAHVVAQSGSATQTHHATFAFGIGFDAEVIGLAEQRPHSKLFLGGVHYARSALTTLLRRYRNRPPHLRVEAGAHRADGVAVMVQVHRPYTYFGRVPLTISRTEDTGLSALVVERLTTPAGVSIAIRAALGRGLDRSRSASVIEHFDKMIIEADPPAPIHADGEHLGVADSVEISSAPGALLVLAPAGD